MSGSGHRSHEVKVADLKDLQSGRPHKVIIPNTDEEIVLVLRKGHVLAIGNRCPHKKAKFHKGDIEDLGEHLGGLCIRCPKHRKKFGGGLYVSLEDGRCRTKKPLDDRDKDKKVRKWSVPKYTTRVCSSGAVYIEVRAESSSSSSSSSDSDDNAQEPVASRPCFTAIVDNVSKRTDAAGDVFNFVLRLAGATVDSFARAVDASGARGVPWHVWLILDGVEREYTPISDLEAVCRSGEITLLIRLYSDGEMSKRLAGARVGTSVSISAPIPTLMPSSWPTASAAVLNGELWRPMALGAVRLGLVCAGTGVTPCAQCLEFIVRALDSDQRVDATSQVVGVLTSNRWAGGPLMVDELLALEQRAPPGSVIVRHALTEDVTASVVPMPAKRARQVNNEQRHHFVGRISMDMLAATLPTHRDGGPPCLAVVTGPPGFAEHCVPLLVGVGYRSDFIVVLDA